MGRAAVHELFVITERSPGSLHINWILVNCLGGCDKDSTMFSESQVPEILLSQLVLPPVGLGLLLQFLLVLYSIYFKVLKRGASTASMFSSAKQVCAEVTLQVVHETVVIVNAYFCDKGTGSVVFMTNASHCIFILLQSRTLFKWEEFKSEK